MPSAPPCCATPSRVRAVLFPAALMVVASGCLVAAAGGAAAGVHLTSRGAEAEVERDITAVENRVRAAVREFGISMTGERTEDAGARREYTGEVDELDITIRLESREYGTHIDVTARRSLTSWDQEYAQRLLARIVDG